MVCSTSSAQFYAQLVPFAFWKSNTITLAPTVIDTDQDQNNSSSTTTVTKPSGLAVGDLMLAFSGSTATGTATAPSGWQKLIDRNFGSGQHYVHYKFADSSDVAASNFTFTLPFGSIITMIVAYRGVDTQYPFEFVKSNIENSAGSIDLLQGTTRLLNTRLVAIVSASGNPSTPSGYNLREFNADWDTMWADTTQTTIGTTTAVSSNATALSLSYHIALNPVDSNGPYIAPADCPAGYVAIAPHPTYTSESFCIMKYEAKAETNAGGSFDADGLGVALGSYKPGSVPGNLPWRDVYRADAISECQSLGPGYDLVSNDQWQSIARNIEQVGANWDGGLVGGGAGINHGHADNNPNAPLAASTDDDQGCINTNNTCDSSTWHVERRTHTLSNGAVVWDMGGNLVEWVKGDNSFNYGGDTYISQITATYGNTGPLGPPKEAFGTQGSYFTFNSGNRGGFGHGWINYNAGAIHRGGLWNEGANAGIFYVNLNDGPGMFDYRLGFRCSYNPSEAGAESDPYEDNVVLLIQPETGDASIVDKSTSAHTVTTQADAAMSTAIADPWGGTSPVVAFDGTGDFLQVADSNDWDYGTDDFTMETWVYFTSLSASQRYGLFAQGQFGTGEWIFALSNNVNEGLDYDVENVNIVIEGSDRLAPLNQWAHIALVRFGNSFKIYVDGSEVASGTSSSTMPNGTDPLDIGGWSGPTNELQGYMTGIRITKGEARYTTDFNPPTQPFDNDGLRQSVEFNGSDEELIRTPSTAGNRKTWTFSTWFKRDASGNYETFYNANGVHLQIGSNNRIEWWDFGTSAKIVLRSSTTLTDTDWHHIVFAMDTTQASANDRARIYLDGVEVTGFSANNRSQISQNSDRELNSTISHRIGMNQYTEIFDGKLSETYFIDGLQLSATNFGYDDSGTWRASEYPGNFGTNGFYLFSKFGPSDSIGIDKSGAANNYTPINMDSTNYSGQSPP